MPYSVGDRVAWTFIGPEFGATVAEVIRTAHGLRYRLAWDDRYESRDPHLEPPYADSELVALEN